MKNIRINNIECRKYTDTKTDDTHYEIIKWQKNPYYNKREEMLSNGYRESFDGDGISNAFGAIGNSCFINEETCYTIAFLYLNRKEPDVYLKSVGSRLIDLDKNELNDFFEVYKIANKKINKKHFK